jgi:hypothetical protein
MGRKSGHDKPYLRKGGGKTFTYKWGPFKDNPKDLNAREVRRRKIKDESPITEGCDAKAGSQGQDYDVQYVAQQIVNPDGSVGRYAYVECDYVV